MPVVLVAIADSVGGNALELPKVPQLCSANLNKKPLRSQVATFSNSAEELDVPLFEAFFLTSDWSRAPNHTVIIIRPILGFLGRVVWCRSMARSARLRRAESRR